MFTWRSHEEREEAWKYGGKTYNLSCPKCGMVLTVKEDLIVCYACLNKDEDGEV